MSSDDFDGGGQALTPAELARVELERLAKSPAPASDAVVQRIEWERARAEVRGAIRSRNMLAVALRALESFPSWPLEQTTAARQKVMHAAIARAAEEWPPLCRGLLVVGPSGCGKTIGAVHAVLCMLRHHLDLRSTFPSVRFAKAYAIANARRQTTLGAEAQLITAVISADVCIIDDIGQEQRVDTSVFEVLDRRYDAKRATIVTSGLTLGEMRERYGEHAARRIVESGEPGKIISTFSREQTK